MFGWLKRLFGGTDAAPMPARPAAAVATAAEPVPTSAPGFGQRRPLVGKSGRVTGFEFLLPPALDRRLAERKDLAPAAAAAHYCALLAATAATTKAGRQALVAMPAALLASPGVAEGAGPGLMLLPLGPAADNATLAALRQRGVRLGVPDGPPAQAAAADFVLLRAAAGGIDTLLLSAQRWHEARPSLTTVALGLESIDDVERALASGITMAGGRFDAAPAGPAARPLHAAAHRICALLNDLALDRDTTIVADAVRGDVALSYRLLRYANSPAIGLSRGVDTVEHAVMLLGRAELGRWLSVMLMSAVAGRQASAALQEDALARDRLLELLARQQGVDHPERLFTLGLMSRLHVLLQMPMAVALEPLRLPIDTRLALLEGSGPWAGYLAVADGLQGDDETQFGLLCQPWGDVDQVLALASQAWFWAAEAARASSGGQP